jgi:hypothetical protein
MLGAIGIQVLLAPRPGHHAVRVERYTQTFNERRRMLEASLTFEFGLSTFKDKHVATSMRSLVNNVSHPNTPLMKLLRAPVIHIAP